MIKSSRTFAFKVIGVAIGLNAIVGIVVLLGSGDLSETEERIMYTIVMISLLSVGLLPAALTWERVRVESLPLLPALSASTLSLAVAVMLAAVWFELDGDAGLESILTLLITGTGAAHLCLLLLARESALRLIASALTLVLGAILLAAVWADNEPDWRLTGITAILWLATSLLVPVRHWASGSPMPSSGRHDFSLVRYCPYCGEPVNAASDDVSCSSCGAAFRVNTITAPDAASERNRAEPADQGP